VVFKESKAKREYIFEGYRNDLYPRRQSTAVEKNVNVNNVRDGV